MKKKFLVGMLLFFGLTTIVSAQQPSREDLEREKREIQEELKQIQGQYGKVKGQTKQSLGQLNMLKRKIALQERYIGSINRELKFIDDDIYKSNIEIYRLQKQLDTLKSQYARTVVYAYKNRSSFDYVNFIFSANNFNDAIRRVSYLKSYRAYREKQVNIIHETQALIAKRQTQQIDRKKEKNEALVSQNKERESLADQKKEKDEVVSKLKTQEKDLAKQIAVKKKRDRDIQNAIAAIIRREIENAKKEAAAKEAAAKKAADAEKKNATASNNAPGTPTTKPANTPATASATPPPKKTASYLELNKEDMELGNDFGNSRGKLPWPVDNGFVMIPFGNYTIDDTKLMGNNPGLTIGTPSAGSAVKAVFDGVVSAVHNYGDGAAIVIRHGKYFTSYSNLSGVSVTKGATVKRGQVIGKAGEADDGSGGQVDFMLMIEANNVNPAPWLRR